MVERTIDAGNGGMIVNCGGMIRESHLGRMDVKSLDLMSMNNQGRLK